MDPNQPVSPNIHHQIYANIHIPRGGRVLQIFAFVFLGLVVGVAGMYGYYSAKSEQSQDKNTITLNGMGTKEIAVNEVLVAATKRDLITKYSTKIEASEAFLPLASKYREDLVKMGVVAQSVSVSTFGDSYSRYEYPYDSSEVESTTPPTYYSTVTVYIALKDNKVDLTDSIVAYFEQQDMTVTADYFAIPSSQDISEARKNALLDATKQVEELEEIGGLRIDGIISVKDKTQEDRNAYPDAQLESKILVDRGKMTAPIKSSVEVVYQLR